MGFPLGFCAGATALLVCGVFACVSLWVWVAVVHGGWSVRGLRRLGACGGSFGVSCGGFPYGSVVVA